MNILILFMIILVLGMLFFYFDWDRTLRLRNTSFSNMYNIYKQKPVKDKKVVGIIETEDPINFQTIKSLMDQSVRLNNIAIQTNRTDVPEDVKKVASVHYPDTVWLRETDKNTSIINIVNGKEYPYDFVETVMEMKK